MKYKHTAQKASERTQTGPVEPMRARKIRADEF